MQTGVPKMFKLFSQTITVECDSKLLKSKDVFGLAKYDENKIVIHKINNNIIDYDIRMEQAYLHETIHFILTKCSHKELSKDESLVELLSQILQQVIRTAKYENSSEFAKKIPTSFNIFYQTIRVEFDNEMFKKDGIYATADFDNNLITLHPLEKDTELNKTKLEQNFLFELSHFLFYKAGRTDLYKNTNLIDVFSLALQQIFNSSVF